MYLLRYLYSKITTRREDEDERNDVSRYIQIKTKEIKRCSDLNRILSIRYILLHTVPKLFKKKSKFARRIFFKSIERQSIGLTPKIESLMTTLIETYLNGHLSCIGVYVVALLKK